MRGIIGLLMAVVVLAFGYWIYMSKLKTTEASERGVSASGVRTDLLSFAQAERIYRATHRTYASVDELYASGTLKKQRPPRDGYTYSWGSSSYGFSIIARCQLHLKVPCPSYSIDQTMRIEQLAEPQTAAPPEPSREADLLARLKSLLAKFQH